MDSLNPARTVVDLNGDWDQYIHNKHIAVVRVPSSLRPWGFYFLKRNFLLPGFSKSERAILHFEGITYFARVLVNGHELGTMVPYVPHEFDFTAQAQEGKNLVEVAIADACPEPGGAGRDELNLGLTVGWETYGGIIRDVWAEIRPAAFIDNVRFGYELKNSYSIASCSPQILVDCNKAQPCEYELALLFGSAEVARSKNTTQLKTGVNEIPVHFEVNAPALWSPSDPNLYQLRAMVKTEAGEHHWQCRTGFREVKTRGRQFLLNGDPIVLNGICRMELWKDQGFTMTQQQRQKDMRGIKRLGANFVRPQPFPHDRGIIQLADELGLLVSEEPGYWWADFRTCPRSFIDLGLNVLERNIRRDWNSPSVMFWLLGNESYFTVSYLKEGKALCNRLDPIQRLVSVAHENAEPAAAKQLFDDGGLDFYDWHAYEFSDDKFMKLPQTFGPSKPLTLTEWGWEDQGDGNILYERFFDRLLDQVEAGNIAGHMFFEWSDYPEFNRVNWITARSGILLQGVVDEAREVRQPIYSRIAGLYAGRRDLPISSAPQQPTVLPLKSVSFLPGSQFAVVDLQEIAESASGQQTWAEFESAMQRFWQTSDFAQDQWKRTGSRFLLWRDPTVQIGGATFRLPVMNDSVRPVLLTAGNPEVTIAINQECRMLHILGQVTFPLGYPVSGKRGETVAVYTLQYASGKTEELPVRNGIEVAQANRIYQATRINPVATSAPPALHFPKDVVREDYQALLWSVPVRRDDRLASLRCRLTGQQAPLGIFAVTTEGM
jgi:hypothetical protein